MDIAGAKALKKRLDSDAEVERQRDRADLDVLAGALPVFRWLGVTRPNCQVQSIEGEDEAAATNVALGSSI